MPAAELAAQQIHTLYSDHHAWLQGWLRRRLGNAADAADLAHDAFLRLIIKPAPRGFDSHGEARAYLRAMAQGMCVNLWHRREIEQAWLDNLVGTDPAGYAGLEDGVDYHWGRIVAGAALTTLLGVGAELAAPENRQDGNRIVIAGRDSAQDSINQVGQEMTRRNMNIQPTLTERPGLPVRIIVNRDLVLRPYQPLFFNRGASR
ncbi:TrbI/VirB10 family protein [Castellaniella defragrans]|uniref:DNA-directed RNA polymerase specialized sigma24 family protein n=1 Tax=Castellaniella defragrans TaxID=75697 RepID=A0A7W9TPE7_CASDE|nr:TrbI/VirB10 family protein [Castellaniella defragrans]KAB0622073.1 hypothetical protein F7Q88_04925 [Castellaniella defragrans]MBB6084384.1 DNA-directed RNA polymerase specialized sigma24 family protein [Castellaniella defragrans]